MLPAARSLLALGAVVAVAWTWRSSDPRVDTMVDPRIRESVASITDSLVAEGLHPEPLVQYALEGTRKHGQPGVIMAGVRKWAVDLRRARTLLGPNASPAEVNAGAQALRAGATDEQLKRFGESRLERRYDAALNTVAYLIKLDVPADTASVLLLNLTLAGASDAQMRDMQDEIERDILAGSPAGASALARAAGLLDVIRNSPPDGATMGATLPSTRGTRLADPMANGSLRGSAVGSQGEIIRPPAPRGKDSKRP